MRLIKHIINYFVLRNTIVYARSTSSICKLVEEALKMKKGIPLEPEDSKLLNMQPNLTTLASAYGVIGEGDYDPERQKEMLEDMDNIKLARSEKRDPALKRKVKDE